MIGKIPPASTEAEAVSVADFVGVALAEGEGDAEAGVDFVGVALAEGDADGEVDFVGVALAEGETLALGLTVFLGVVIGDFLTTVDFGTPRTLVAVPTVKMALINEKRVLREKCSILKFSQIMV